MSRPVATHALIIVMRDDGSYSVSVKTADLGGPWVSMHESSAVPFDEVTGIVGSASTMMADAIVESHRAVMARRIDRRVH